MDHTSSRPARSTGRTAAIGALVAAVIVSGSSALLPHAALAADELPDTLITTEDTVWSYSDDNTDPAAGSGDRFSWTTPEYDDSDWKTATGAFGAKHGSTEGISGGHTVNTLLTQYIDGTDVDVPTFHFRTDIDLTADQIASISALRGEVVYDDAVQIMVNGEKIAGFNDDRVEAAPEAERNLTYAGSSGDAPVTSTFTIPADALQEGENTLSIALYQDRETSSDIYLDVPSLVPAAVDQPAQLSDIVLTVGSDESERSLTWYSDVDTPQGVQIAPADSARGGAFPAEEATFVEAEGSGTTSGEFRRSATLSGLEQSTEYAYRVGSEESGWSDVATFRADEATGDYGFLFFGDPQIGASGDRLRDQAGWTDTLDVAEAAYPDSELLFSAGDQVEHAANEDEYESYLAPDQLRRIPTVPVNGNHDVGSKAYEQHFTVPNWDQTAGAATSPTASGGDYWFMHKGTLFMVINSNSLDTESHAAFLEKVMAEHGDEATWTVLAFHHSIYSVAAHANDGDIEERRDDLPTVISDLGIDMVLQGHDHSYTRSYLIEDGEIANPEEQAAQEEVVAEDGEVLYVTANSASGSKYYGVTEPDAWYASVINQERVRNYSHVEVTDEAITVTTLRSEQNGDGDPVNSVVDEVTLTRARDGGPEEPAAEAWDAEEVYQAGDRVAYDGAVHEAQWYSHGEQPGTSPYGSWAEIGAPQQCEAAGGEVPAWTDSQVYGADDQAVLDGELYEAQWYSRNQQPGDPYGPWQPLGAC